VGVYILVSLIGLELIPLNRPYWTSILFGENQPYNWSFATSGVARDVQRPSVYCRLPMFALLYTICLAANDRENHI
jgi:hypothetical protein